VVDDKPCRPLALSAEGKFSPGLLYLSLNEHILSAAMAFWDIA
jgi:hypothetical protein